MQIYPETPIVSRTANPQHNPPKSHPKSFLARPSINISSLDLINKKTTSVTMADMFNVYNDMLEGQLKDPNVISAKAVEALEQLEVKTGAKRVQIVYGLAGVFALYLVLGQFAGLVCNLVGFAYPCYMSFKAIRTEDKSDDTQWLTYWCVFGFFSVIDAFADPIMRVIPIYWLLKCIFMVYLYHPVIMGAKHVYEKVVAPALAKVEAHLQQQREAAAGAPPAEAPKQE